MKIIEYNSEKYPVFLKKIDNPPEKLYAEGNLELLNSKAISIIGSRACSISGIKSAKQFAKDLASNGITIVSGMALGIDTAAHTGCLEVGGNTIAVLGSGFSKIFPKENIKLYHEIIKNNGLVISEYPPETPKKSNQFLERNRIVSGLSVGVLVIEAAYRSGTSVTASLAKKQGKEIFCIPHELNDKHGIGTNRLIKNGAQLVTCADDILNKINNIEDSKVLDEEAFEQLEFCEPEQYADVYNALIGPPANVDEICARINKTAPYVNTALFTLELQGFITKTQFGYQVTI